MFSHLSKIKSEGTWKHAFLYHTYIIHVLYFYCILALLQHKNEVNIKYQATVRALRASLSFPSLMIAQDHTSAHPSALAACPGAALGFQAPALFLTPSALLPTWLHWLGIALACDLPGLGLPVNSETTDWRCRLWPASWDWVTLVSQLHISWGAALLTPLPWQSVLSALSPFGYIFNKQHGSHWMVLNVWWYRRKEIFG